MTTPDQTRQILAALQNHRHPGRTHGGKLFDAILHCQQSENAKGPDVTSIEAFLCNVLSRHHEQEACRGCHPV
jgi:hypothetical protein